MFETSEVFHTITPVHEIQSHLMLLFSVLPLLLVLFINISFMSLKNIILQVLSLSMMTPYECVFPNSSNHSYAHIRGFISRFALVGLLVKFKKLMDKNKKLMTLSVIYSLGEGVISFDSLWSSNISSQNNFEKTHHYFKSQESSGAGPSNDAPGLYMCYDHKAHNSMNPTATSTKQKYLNVRMHKKSRGKKTLLKRWKICSPIEHFERIRLVWVLYWKNEKS